MALSWNEIRDRALTFSKEWVDTSNEDADAKPFLVEFFNVFGVSRKKVASFEHRVKKLDAHDGYIDLLWKGNILIKMKSRGKSLDKAFTQAKDYLHGLKQHELPKYILVSDFETFRLHDLEEDSIVEFKLNELVQNVQHFASLLGYQKKVYKEQDPANIKAAELMGKLHDRLEEIGYRDHKLEVYLVRILFCLFAEDTTIFNKQQFQDLIEQRTSEDGSDLAGRLQELFQVLNTAKNERFTNLDEQLADFPYVNGKLFEEPLATASFDAKMRLALLDCCYLDWSRISPAIFGSMFQSVMNPVERRNLGAHYTSETNILKLIKPLFLDDLWREFESVKDNRSKLQEFHQRLSRLKFLDPACGCGNFLVITYRELRLLEIEILRVLRKSGEQFLNVGDIIWLDVDMMYGIEFEEFPARIAEVAMWLIDHQMNMQISNEFGQYFVRLPLKKSATIVHGNALRIDWADVVGGNPTGRAGVSSPRDEEYTLPTGRVSASDASSSLKATNEIASGETRRMDPIDVSVPVGDEPVAPSSTPSGSGSVGDGNVGFHPTLLPASLSGTRDLGELYILGNPPFVGKHLQNADQKLDMGKVFANIPTIGVLDYVTAWYVKAARYIQDTRIKVAFVSTSSISQGEQVAVLWNLLYGQFGIKIHFAHRTFSWRNEAKGNAGVHCVIIGFANFDTGNKRIFEYENIKGEPHEIKAKNINPYLVEGRDLFVTRRKKPISDVPELLWGSKPVDDGNFLFSEIQYKEIIERHPVVKKYLRAYVGADELLYDRKRYCLWLKDANPSELRNIPEIRERIEKVREFRSKSTKEATRKMAAFPTLFAEIRETTGSFLIIPEVSSELRKYLPIGFDNEDIIVSNRNYSLPNSNKFHFGVLSSTMHLAWTLNICGRLESRITYSSGIVYNNFPWPENPSEKQIAAIETAAQKVLDARSAFPNSSLADLYDPLTMPPALVKAHNDLDRAVDLAYGPQPFTTEAGRMVFLFELYEKYTAGLFVEPKRRKKKNYPQMDTDKHR